MDYPIHIDTISKESFMNIQCKTANAEMVTVLNVLENLFVNSQTHLIINFLKI